MMMIIVMMLLLHVTAAGATTETQRKYRIALVSKSFDNPFWGGVHQACADKTLELAHVVECFVAATPVEAQDPTGSKQAAIIDDLVLLRRKQQQQQNINNNDTNDMIVDGIAVAVRNIDTVGPAIDRAVEAGVTVVTLDSDAPQSSRMAYIGTDNYFFGTQIAKVLKQLNPNGGTYAAIADTPPNLAERLQGFQDEIKRDNKNSVQWHEAPGSPAMYHGNASLAMEHMYTFAQQEDITTIVPVMGAAMRSGGWEEFVGTFGKDRFTLVSGDGMANQLELLSRGYAHGLVGQMPYEMGATAIQVLHDYLVHGIAPEQEFVGTNVLTHISIPLTLPDLQVDHNLIGNLHVVGYLLFGLIAFLSICFAVWTLHQRNAVIVRAAQPIFLSTVLLGVVLMGGSMIPLSFDDNGEPSLLMDQERALICMSTPWLGFGGFSLTFSALFAKTMRVNKVFNSTERRTTVTATDVMVPFAILFCANMVILTIWTVVDPLVYTRQDLPGTDGWNRVIATYGACQCDHAARYLIPLAAVNVGVLILANWQAYVARHIVEEFADTKYIGLVVASLLQAAVIGVPILFLLRESPQAFYLLLIFVIFVVCGAVLVLIFVPKLFLAHLFSRYTEEQQSRMIKKSVRGTRANIKASQSFDSRDEDLYPETSQAQSAGVVAPSIAAVQAGCHVDDLVECDSDTGNTVADKKKRRSLSIRTGQISESKRNDAEDDGCDDIRVTSRHVWLAPIPSNQSSGRESSEVIDFRYPSDDHNPPPTTTAVDDVSATATTATATAASVADPGHEGTPGV
uniref:G-protein coupled receptors family 3 profile domain-containing protein n=1 Tax=Amphora coffeiformis TaxID=265554 RepID=A0A7S3L1A8_9STRA